MQYRLSSIFIFLISLLFSIDLFGQDKIEIINSDMMLHSVESGLKIRRLVGNVKLLHEGIYLNCDSALHYYEKNKIDAFGHIHINKGDSLDIYADTLKYDGNTRNATLYHNVLLTDKIMNLTTHRLTYDLNKNMAVYNTGAVITSKENRLTSNTGYYYGDSRETFFKQDVIMKDPNYSLYTDTLKYDIQTQIAYFISPTEIISEENSIYCERGWYDKKNEKALFAQNTFLSNPPQTLYSDSLFYNRQTGYGKAICNVRWADTVKKALINSDYAEFIEEDDYLLATNHAYLTNIIDEDSLYVKADTLISYFDTSGYRIFTGFHRVRIYKDNLQGICDSVSYSYADSTFFMYYEPVLWANKSQMTGDTISMMISNHEMKLLTLHNLAFIANKSGPGMYDQIKGKYTYGYFENSQLNKMLIRGNGQSIYYGKDDDDAFIGVNKVICSDMAIHFVDNKIDRINFMTKPDAVFHPIQDVKPEEFILKDFKWMEHLKPISKEDIFNK